MRRRRHASPAESYWPGYVDALTNVVLNLLFLIAIFASGVFALGMAAAHRKSAVVDAPVQVISVPVGSDEVRIRVAETELAQRGQVSLEGVRRLGEKSLMSIAFSAEAVTMGEADRRSLWSQMQPLLREQAQEPLLLWAVVDLDEPSHRRAAYLRVMAVRDWLVASGLQPERVRTRLLPGATGRVSGQVVYVLLQGASADEALMQSVSSPR
jgi:hypothetical protein